MNFTEELRWRGMIHDVTPGVEEYLRKETATATAYVGIDPTADSLHIGHLVGVMMLRHFQRCGHKPLALVGGATGMIGDPSMKSMERHLLSEEELHHNQECIQRQLSKFLDFSSGAPNAAEMMNNYDWMKNYGFLAFIRDIGKHVTVNYMMSKDSVKKRLSGEGDGMSFTEFTYQLVQGYDFLWLYRHKRCCLQMGGSDQWGNITTGVELIRRMDGGEAFALTCPLITKADGGKFGKTEAGNVWLDARRTSPYRFYQFWLNVSDADAGKYIRIFTGLPEEEIDSLTARHTAAPHLRILQKTLAEEVTAMVHSAADVQAAENASQILFGQGTEASLSALDEDTFRAVFEGVPQYRVERSALEAGIPLLDLLSVRSAVFPSKGEARRMIEGGGLNINKEKANDANALISTDRLIKNKYLLVQKGKKNYSLIICE
ncbi:MAG: tyrosine--tRNA ligase [Bacteroidales bacterium]|jgi:tyrosyl-tRNA synthetase|nr:tyrosine--tRNA ligase [Bacteroidales bacterium]